MQSANTRPRTAPVRVAIFGAGAGGIRLWSRLVVCPAIEIVAFIDNDAQKQGTVFVTTPIRGLAWMDERDYDVVLVASIHHAAICRQLEAHGVPPDRTVVLSGADDELVQLERLGLPVRAKAEGAGAPDDIAHVRHLERQIAELRSQLDAAGKEAGDLRRTIALLSAERTNIEAPPGPFEWLLGAHIPEPPVPTPARTVTPGRVSVIVPVYNAVRYLEQTVGSVWAQTVDPTLVEIVLVDDGSTDGSYELALRLQAESRMRMDVLAHPGRANRGVSATRNLGLAHATGEFIALLDADDLFRPARLARGLAHMNAHPECQALCSLGDNVDASGEVIVGANGTTVAGAYATLADGLRPPFTFEQLWATYPVANSSLLMRRTAIDGAGGYATEMAHQAEDYLVVLKLSLDAPVHCLDEKLMAYRHHDASYTTQYQAQSFSSGVRLEMLYYLTHWMVVQRPEHRERGLALFRRHYPFLHSRTHAGLRAIDRLLGEAAALVDTDPRTFLEARLREAAELDALRRVMPTVLQNAREAERRLAHREVGALPSA